MGTRVSLSMLVLSLFPVNHIIQFTQCETLMANPEILLTAIFYIHTFY